MAAAVLSTPFAAFTTSQGSLTPSVVMLGIAVAGLSSVLPYTLELMALRRVETTTFAVLMSLGRDGGPCGIRSAMLDACADAVAGGRRRDHCQHRCGGYV